jgi:hypothetical protein
MPKPAQQMGKDRKRARTPERMHARLGLAPYLIIYDAV